MARREFEEITVYRSKLPNVSTQIVAPMDDLSAIKRIRVVNRSTTSPAYVTLYTSQESDAAESNGQYIFNKLLVRPGGFAEWSGWHVLDIPLGDALFESIYGYTTGEVDCFIDGARMEALL